MKRDKIRSKAPFLFIVSFFLILSACSDSEDNDDFDSADTQLSAPEITVPLATPVTEVESISPTTAPAPNPTPIPSVLEPSGSPLIPIPSPKPPRVFVFTMGTDEAHPLLRNQKGELGNTRSTDIEVREGDKLEIRPNLLIRERRRAPEMKVARVDNDVCVRTEEACVATEPVFERRCDDQCHVCVKCHPFPPSCYPWRCCDNVCQDVKVGDRCVRTEQRCVQRENQWKELTAYSGLGESEMIKNLAPMTEAPLMMAGLKLKFTYPSSLSNKEVVCPFASFKPEVDNEKMVMILANNEGCPPLFSRDEREYPVLSLVNEMSAPMNYLEGNLIKTWDGRVLEKPTEAIFYPIIDFLGSITVRETEPSRP